MAIGFLLLDNTTYAVPDKQMKRAGKPKVLLAQFGDGYEQRAADGINSIAQEFSISFMKRTKEEIDDIIALFESKKGVTAFTFTYPDSNNSGERAIKVICDDWSTEYMFDNYYGASASFRRVYE